MSLTMSLNRGPGCVVPGKDCPGVEIDPRALDIGGLTKAQRRSLGCIAIGEDGGHSARTLKALVDIGAIVRIDEPHGFVKIHRYGVPLPVHMAWAQWCADNCDDEGNER